MFRGLSGPHLHQPAATQEAAGHVADHGANGPEVVLAVGVAPSRRWAEQWYGLVVAVAPCSVAGCGPGCVSPCSPHALLPAVALAVCRLARPMLCCRLWSWLCVA